MPRWHILVLASLASIAGSADSTPAATSNSALSVTATAIAQCTVVAAPVAFATLSSTTMTSALGSVSVNCTAGNAISIALDGGANATSGQRRLANGSNYINYNLYQPTAAGNAQSNPPVAWGNGGVTATGSAFSATCSGTAQMFNVYAQIPAGQTMYSGTYSDAVTLTLTY